MADRNLHRTNCSILKMLLVAPSSLEGKKALNTATAASNIFPPFPPWTSTARPNAVDRITSIVILLYSLKGDKVLCVYRCVHKVKVSVSEPISTSRDIQTHWTKSKMWHSELGLFWCEFIHGNYLFLNWIYSP